MLITAVKMLLCFYSYYNQPPEESAIKGLKNPMCEAFPRVASCTYWRYGTGGGQNRKCSMNFMPIYVSLQSFKLFISEL